MRIAIVHEWIAARAGSEQTFEALGRAFPEADLYALSCRPGAELDTGGRKIRTTWLDNRIFRERRSVTLPLMPFAWRSLGRGRYDVVISSHHAFAHTNLLAEGTGTHLSYVHSPARYLWSPEIDGRGGGHALLPARAILRSFDRRATHRVRSYAANSSAVAERIQQFWGRDAMVIAPPVHTDFFHPTDPVDRQGYLLAVGRWIPYKNLSYAVSVANHARMPVKIAGSGPDRLRIEAAAAAATVPVEIIESPSNERLRDLYQRAAVLLFPAHEDFGLVPVEAQAAGTPVVAPAMGGVLDTVINGVSGVLTESLSLAELTDAIHVAQTLKPDDCIKSAERFNVGRFIRNIQEWVATYTGRPAE